MSSGEYRRSLRIFELDARRAQQAKSQNKGNGTSEVATEQDFSTGRNSNQKRGRKKIKIRPVQDLVDDTAKNQVQKAASSINEDHQTNTDQAAVISSSTAIPEKKNLEMLLSTLQKRDSNKIFAQPVNPEEVEGYYDVIKEPMDFGTIEKKLDGGSYKTLEEFENDVFLVFSNAMLFNASSTIYYRQARAIKDFAIVLLNFLKTNPENFEIECSMRRGPGRRTKAEAGILNSHSCNKAISNEKVSMGRRGERRSEYFEVERRDTYRPWTSFLNENESLASAVYRTPKQFNLNNEANIGYIGSLIKFVKDLGPTAQMVARQKVERLVEFSDIQNASLNRELQAPKNQISATASAQKGITVAQSLNLLGSAAGSQIFSGGKFGIQSSYLNREKTSTDNNMKIIDALSGGIAQASFSTEALGDSRGKQVQAMSSNHQLQALKNQISAAAFAQKGIKVSPSLIIPGNTAGEKSGIQSSTVGGERTSTLNSMKIWDALSGGITHTGCSMETLNDLKGKKVQDMSREFEMGTDFKEGMANRNIGVQLGSSFPISGSGDENFGFPAAWNRNSNPDKYDFTNMMQDSMNPIQRAGLGSSESRMLEFVPTRNSSVPPSSWWLPSQSMTEWSSGSRVNGSMRGMDSHYLGAGIHQNQAMVDGEGPCYTGNIEQGAGMHQIQAMVDGEGPCYTGSIEQGGQVSNWFKPTELEPQPLLDNWFQPQLSSAEFNLSGETRPMQQQSWVDFPMKEASSMIDYES